MEGTDTQGLQVGCSTGIERALVKQEAKDHHLVAILLSQMVSHCLEVFVS